MNQTLLPGLYIVATPIGNLGDVSVRAAATFKAADAVAAEDSRVTGKLLHHLGIKAKIIPYHDHVSERVRADIISRLSSQVIVLASDAGTPLISDPGYKLVREAREAGHMVTTIPGPCAAIAGLTLAGLPTDRFLFMGFLPSKEKARRDSIAEVAIVRATLVFYESGPRLGKALSDLAALLGAREAAVTREITKLHEECVTGTLPALAARYAESSPKGEIVIVVGPPLEREAVTDTGALDAMLADAMTRLSPAKAAGEISRATGADRKLLYSRAMELKA
jgi:16S rRNA (cytidine1402-2'-O)-methyltransferase